MELQESPSTSGHFDMALAVVEGLKTRSMLESGPSAVALLEVYPLKLHGRRYMNLREGNSSQTVFRVLEQPMTTMERAIHGVVVLAGGAGARKGHMGD